MIMNMFNMAHWPCFSTVQSASSAFFGLEMKPSMISAIIGCFYTAAQDDRCNDGAPSAGSLLWKLVAIAFSSLALLVFIGYKPVVAVGMLYLICLYLLVAGSSPSKDASKCTSDIIDDLEAGFNIIYNDVASTTKAPLKAPLRSCLKSKLPERAPKECLTVRLPDVVQVLKHKVSLSLGPNFCDFYCDPSMHTTGYGLVCGPVMRNDDGSPMVCDKPIDFRDKGRQNSARSKSREQREAEGKKIIQYDLDEQYQGRTGEAWKLADRTVETLFYEELKELKEVEEMLYWELRELCGSKQQLRSRHPDKTFQFFEDQHGETFVAVDPDVPLMPLEKANYVKRDILGIWGV
jgi:hypothetical protein